MKKVLLYHLYPIHHWREITDHLLHDIPHSKLVVHTSLPQDSREEFTERMIKEYFSKYTLPSEFLFSNNSTHPERDALIKFLDKIDCSEYDILTYMHSKGVTKPYEPYIRDWCELMRYFIIDRMELCEKAFKKGYILYGVNKSLNNADNPGFRGSKFFYEGNFVSVNLKKVGNLKALQAIYLEYDYHGLEGFWGKICEPALGFSPFDSGINHYLSPLPEHLYKSKIQRLRYKAVKYFYQYVKPILLSST